MLLSFSVLAIAWSCLPQSNLIQNDTKTGYQVFMVKVRTLLSLFIIPDYTISAEYSCFGKRNYVETAPPPLLPCVCNLCNLQNTWSSRADTVTPREYVCIGEVAITTNYIIRLRNRLLKLRIPLRRVQYFVTI